MLYTPPDSSSPLTSTPLFTADAAQLAQHLSHCKYASGPLHRARGAVELADAFLSSRFVSTLVVLAVILTAVASAIAWMAS